MSERSKVRKKEKIEPSARKDVENEEEEEKEKEEGSL